MPRYTISVPSADGKRLYLCPRGDSLSYVLKDIIVGAAVWNFYEEALLAKQETVGEDASIRAFTSFC